MAEYQDKEIEELVRRMLPPALIFADHEDHVADLRRRAKTARVDFLNEHEKRDG